MSSSTVKAQLRRREYFIHISKPLKKVETKLFGVTIVQTIADPDVHYTRRTKSVPPRPTGGLVIQSARATGPVGGGAV